MSPVFDPRSQWAGRLHHHPKPLIAGIVVGVVVTLIGLAFWFGAMRDLGGADSAAERSTISASEVESAIRSNLSSNAGARLDVSRVSCLAGTYRSGNTVRCKVPYLRSAQSERILVRLTLADGDWQFYIEMA